MKTMNIGLVGVGGMGSVHYANYKEIEGCQVAAVCGGSKRAKETAEKWGLPCYPSIREMVENCDIDIVDICTPTYLHHDMVMESLDCGKDTICEKPIALSLKDAKEMLDKAEQKDCMLYIAQVLQFTKEV